MKEKYKVLKTKNNYSCYVNDSEGIVMEWDTYEAAKKIAEMFECNSVGGYKYVVISPKFG